MADNSEKSSFEFFVFKNKSKTFLKNYDEETRIIV